MLSIFKININYWNFEATAMIKWDYILKIFHPLPFKWILKKHFWLLWFRFKRKIAIIYSLDQIYFSITFALLVTELAEPDGWSEYRIHSNIQFFNFLIVTPKDINTEHNIQYIEYVRYFASVFRIWSIQTSYHNPIVIKF